MCCKASCSVYRLYIHHGGRRGASGHAHSVFVRANSVGPVLLTTVARTGRCHPPLYAADPGRTSYVVHARPPQLTPEVSGSSGPHCVEQVDFWGESLEGRERARQSSILCRCRKSSPPRGTNSIMAMGPAGGQYSPTPLRRNGFQLGGGVRQRTSHRKLACSDRGGISCLDTCRGTVFPHPTPDRIGRSGTRCIPPGFFSF